MEMASMFEDAFQYGLMVLTLILAILTVELKNILYAAITFGGMCTAIGALYWLLNAPYVSVFQILIYAGAVVAIFLAAIMLTTRKEGIR
jgi:NADH:ubiquinone oxidoreductase subunit 6 (subunit J)